MRPWQIPLFDGATGLAICGTSRRHSWANSAHPTPPSCTRARRFVSTSTCSISGPFSFHWKTRPSFFADMATHSVLSLEAPASAAVGLTLIAAGHASVWPILRGGAQALPDASLAIWKILAAVFKSIMKLPNSHKRTSFLPTSLPDSFFASQALNCPCSS